MNCSKLIAMNIGGENCASNVAGYRSKAVVLNFEDIVDVVRNTDNPHIVEEITLAEGKFGYYVEQRGAKRFDGSNGTMAQGTYENTITNGVVFQVPFDATTTNNFTQPLLNGGEVVIILESKSKGVDGKSAFEIYGLDQGLTMTAGERNVNDERGKYISMTVSETTTSAGDFLFNESYAATKAMVESLVKKS